MRQRAVRLAVPLRQGAQGGTGISAGPNDGLRQLGYAHYTRYQAERTEVGFSRADVDYAVFDYTEDGQRTAGVRVTTADGSGHEVACAGAIRGQLDTLGTSLRCDPDNALNGGACR